MEPLAKLVGLNGIISLFSSALKKEFLITIKVGKTSVSRYIPSEDLVAANNFVTDPDEGISFAELEMYRTESGYSIATGDSPEVEVKPNELIEFLESVSA